MTKLITASAMALAVLLTALPAPTYAADGRACFKACQVEMTRTNGWNRFPRGYCRQRCNYYSGAPADVLRSSGRVGDGGAQCLRTCRTKVRAEPQIASGDQRYCKKQCGVRN